ncbi:D-inositol-3-phosphate glycosyltransferase [subsurface metagenome]
MKICLVAFYSPYGDNPLARLSDLLHIFEPLAEEIFLITADVPNGANLNKKARLMNITYSSNSRLMPAKLLRQLAAQLTISWHLLKISRQVDLIFWGISAHSLIIPMLLARLMRKKTILFLASESSKVLTNMFGVKGFILSQIHRVIEDASYSLCHTIVVNSTELLNQPRLVKHRDKSFPLACPIRFMNINIFKISKPLKQRPKRIGFVGRLSAEKGVRNLVMAMPLVLDRCRDLELTLIGDGPQNNELRGTVKENGLSDKVKLTDWVAHAELPAHLNEMQLLVLPSFTEGLPTIALEAMACGTPVLATPVGGVPELISDDETGFIMEDNSPECIARNIIRALDYPGLDKLIENAQALVEKEFTYDQTVERYRQVLNSLGM